MRKSRKLPNDNYQGILIVSSSASKTYPNYTMINSISEPGGGRLGLERGFLLGSPAARSGEFN